MTRYKVKFIGTITVHRTIEIEDGDDWDGRPVNDQFDAADLAYDIVIDNAAVWDDTDPDPDWQVDYVEVINGEL